MLNVLILTWEFPPKVLGELGYYVRELAIGLRKIGCEVQVMTLDDYTYFDEFMGVKVAHIANPVKTHFNLLTWLSTLNTEVERICSEYIYNGGYVDVINVHDWHLIPAGIALAKTFGLPLVLTFHSIEEMRSACDSNFSQAIRIFEREGIEEANAVIATSEDVANSIKRLVAKDLDIKVIAPSDDAWISKTLAVYMSVVEK